MPSAFSRVCGGAASSAGVLFLAWGYLHTGDPYVYGDPYRPYLDSAVAALAVLVPTLFLVGLTGLAGLLAKGMVGQRRILAAPVAAVGFALAFAGAAVGVVRGIEGGLGWYDAYFLGRQNTTAFGLFVPWWIEWTSVFLAGLTVVGVAALSVDGPKAPRALPLVMGVAGWAYYLTGSGGPDAVYLSHVFFGLSFGLCWVALGSALFRREQG